MPDGNPQPHPARIERLSWSAADRATWPGATPEPGSSAPGQPPATLPVSLRRRSRSASGDAPGQPPATAGTMERVWPSVTGVFRPSRKRTSSSARNTFTKRRNWPASSKRRPASPGWAASSAFRASPTVDPSTATSPAPPVRIRSWAGTRIEILISCSLLPGQRGWWWWWWWWWDHLWGHTPGTGRRPSPRHHRSDGIGSLGKGRGHRGAPFGLSPGDPDRRGLVEQTHPAQLVEAFGHFGQLTARADGHHHVVGRLPSQLLSYFEGQGLGPLGVIGTDIDIDEGPRRPLAGQLGTQPVDVVIVALDGDDAAAVDGCHGDLGRLEIRGGEHHRIHAGPRRVGGDRVGQVPRRGTRGD